MPEIILTRGYRAIVDELDFEIYGKLKWHYSYGYAVRKNKLGTTWLHREIAGNPAGEVDHINGNSLDNRRKNLRQVSHSQNNMNKTIQTNNSTGYKGVHRLKSTGRFQSYIKKNGKRIHLGTYDTAMDAARAYMAVAEILFGEFIRKEKI